jgi:hypothetical protein
VVVEIKPGTWDTTDVNEGGMDRTALGDAPADRTITASGGSQVDPDDWYDYQAVAQAAQDEVDRERHNAEAQRIDRDRIRPEEGHPVVQGPGRGPARAPTRLRPHPTHDGGVRPAAAAVLERDPAAALRQTPCLVGPQRCPKCLP